MLHPVTEKDGEKAIGGQGTHLIQKCTEYLNLPSLFWQIYAENDKSEGFFFENFAFAEQMLLSVIL
jgi:hypothetical protein